MRAILICGYKEVALGPLGVEKNANGQTIIDLQIARLQQLGFEVVCVLSGLQADDQLRNSPSIADCELAFDTNDTTSLMTNIKAGLAATDGEGCFVLPLEVPCPDAIVWNHIREHWRRIGFHTATSILQILDNQGALWQRGFPILITRHGNHQFRTLENLHSLIDARLEYQHLEFSPGLDLDSFANAL